MRLVIGLVGEKGSGKETFTNILKETLPHKVILRIRFSDILKETLDLWGMSVSRENLQILGHTMRQAFGNDIVAKALKKRLDQAKYDIAIIDGVRYKEDADLIRSFPQNLLVYITAETEVRFKRISHRTEKVGEKGISLEQFLKEEQAPTEVPIPSTGQGSEIKIANNGSFEEFKKSIAEFTKNPLFSQYI